MQEEASALFCSYHDNLCQHNAGRSISTVLFVSLQTVCSRCRERHQHKDQFWPSPLVVPEHLEDAAEVPDSFKCPITFSIMKEPATTRQGMLSLACYIALHVATLPSTRTVLLLACCMALDVAVNYHQQGLHTSQDRSCLVALVSRMLSFPNAGMQHCLVDC